MAQNQIFLHVGPPKTGTSSIQRLLSQSYAVLLDRGVLYPRAGRVNSGKQYQHNDTSDNIDFQFNPIKHKLLHWALKGRVVGIDPETCWSYILSEQKQTKSHTILLSDEGFASLSVEQMNRLKSLMSGFKVNVIFYLRDPFSRIVSSYKQSVKIGNCCKSFEGYLAEIVEENRLYSLKVYLERFRDCFGADSLIVRDFDKIINDDVDLEYDFLKILGIESVDFEYFKNKDISNASPSNGVIRLLRELNRIEYALGKHQSIQYVFRVLRDLVRHGSLKWPFIDSLIGVFFRQTPLYSEHDKSYYLKLTEQWYQDTRDMFVTQDRNVL